MKKIISFFWALMLIFSFSSSPVLAASSEAELVISSEPVLPGEDVELTISVKNNPGFSGLAFYLDYNSTDLTFVSARKADRGIVPSDASMQTVDPKDLDEIHQRVSLQLLNWTDDLTDDGTIWTVTFHVSENAFVSPVISISLDLDNTFNKQLDDVAFVMHDHEISIRGSQPDRSTLAQVIEKAEALNPDEFRSSIEDMLDVLNSAKALMEAPATQNEINDMTQELHHNLLLLRKVPKAGRFPES